MRIEREKFFALTATMAGFVPNAACAFAFGEGAAGADRATRPAGGPGAPQTTTTPAGAAVAARATCAKLRP